MVQYKPEEIRTGNICVFTSGNYGADKTYMEHARRMGELIAKNGFGLVFGAVGGGMMRGVSRAAKEGGAKVIGVLPYSVDDPFLLKASIAPFVAINDELIGTKSLEERKHMMLGMSDAVIALAGGFGTFDEIATTVELGRGRKTKGAASRLVILNTLGFYDGLEQQFDRMHDERLVDAKAEDTAYFAETPEDAMDYILRSLESAPDSTEHNTGQ